jgi:hypothetical protein
MLVFIIISNAEHDVLSDRFNHAINNFRSSLKNRSKKKSLGVYDHHHATLDAQPFVQRCC